MDNIWGTCSVAGTVLCTLGAFAPNSFNKHMNKVLSIPILQLWKLWHRQVINLPYLHYNSNSGRLASEAALKKKTVLYKHTARDFKLNRKSLRLKGNTFFLPQGPSSQKELAINSVLYILSEKKSCPFRFTNSLSFLHEMDHLSVHLNFFMSNICCKCFHYIIYLIAKSAPWCIYTKIY